MTQNLDWMIFYLMLQNFSAAIVEPGRLGKFDLIIHLRLTACRIQILIEGLTDAGLNFD